MNITTETLPEVHKFENATLLLARQDAIGAYARLNAHVDIKHIYEMVLAMDEAHFYEFSRALRKGRRLYALAGGKQDK